MRIDLAAVAFTALTLCAIGLAACRGDEAPELAPPPATTTAPDAPSPAGDEGPTLTPAARARADETLTGMRHRPSCNRVSGCPGLVTLAQEGAALVPWIIDKLSGERADGYWVFRLISLLGQLDDPRALPFLHGLLEDPRWEMPIRAAQALAALERPESLEPLRATLARAQAKARPELEAMARFALSRLDPASRDAHRDAIVALVPMTQAAMATVPPVVVDVLLEVVREARLPRALPAARIGALHTNRFVREQALRTLGALNDTGGIPYALTRLDDPLPSIRALALETLQAITGVRHMTDAGDWREWAAKYGFADIPDAAAAPPEDGSPGEEAAPAPE